MAKSPKPRKQAAPASRGPALANPALRMIAIRVGAGVLLGGAGVALYLWHGRSAQVAHEKPPVVAAAPAKPAPPPAPVAPPPAPAEEDPPPQPPHRGIVLDDAKPMSAALRAAFDTWLMGTYAKCWKAPKSLPDGEPYLPKVRVAFKDSGELAGPPKLVNPPSDPAWKPHAEAALKAVKGCDPLHVPDKYAEYYPSWKSRTVYFDPTRN